MHWKKLSSVIDKEDSHTQIYLESEIVVHCPLRLPVTSDSNKYFNNNDISNTQIYYLGIALWYKYKL